MIRVGQYRQLDVLTYHVTSAGRGASSALHYPMPGTSASLCRPALTVLCHHFGVLSSLLRHLGTGSGMEPCPASSSGRVINTEHINQLSCLHAQSFKFFNLCSVRPSIILFWKKVACKKFPCPNFVCDTQIQIPHLLGGFLHEAFSLLHIPY